MSEFVLKRGLDLPITGAPDQKISEGAAPASVALIGADYVGLKPKMLIAEGDEVVRGTPLFCHKDDPEVMYVAPAKGRVRAINRGARRVLQSVVIDVDDISDAGMDFGKADPAALTGDDLRAKLAASGLWTGFLTRPYAKVPALDSAAADIFVTAMDSEPLSADAAVILAEKTAEFRAGVTALTKLTEGRVFVCTAPGTQAGVDGIERVETHSFAGPHPAGLAGTHMHFLSVPTAEKTVWSIGYQDVIAIGALLLTGHLDITRVISLAGPLAANPRLVRTVTGASLAELTDGEIAGDEPCRVISGSVLSGTQAEGPFAYLGRYARQVTLIKEDADQSVLGWIIPQPNKFSVLPVLASAMSKNKLFNMTSNLNGGRRAMVPTGVFERLMPQDFLPTQLLRALLVMDTDTAQALGALELAEEDVALCAFACPAKYEYGLALRDSLQKIEKEG
ncbi:Na(+)-translocating NADH-quinone reductase subunit A [Pseudoruegeria sp. SHC-113]|uniref:Na(+)-translocating NADH-quinone reductase subunit A n=1 Tax=Pseudoruegeria sp. SHC-113 TaxID=2855439 RepID=UPI0021BAEC1C|nr:Na(+)-translocating NADH-quinone reductase subunit A [Pseudoruegeria sp. SHC-113]MCT8159137.1 Na(+)-translocating NADH-quinone reductase subunit A [Pseudoruegeria sp. SHC-113]